MLVVCGAVGTEPAYLEGLRKSRRNPAVRIKVLGKAVAPDQLVRYADKIGEGYDEVWCVVDTDEFDIDAALRAARGTGVSLAVSNPCFEVWLVLHFQDYHRESSCYGQVAEALRRHVPGYDKSRLVFADYDAGVEQAVRRARKIDPTGADHGRNPGTGMWKLALSVLPDGAAVG